MQRLQIFHLVLILLGGLVVLFIVAPLLGMLLNTTAPQLFETLKDQEVTGSIWLTLMISFFSTVLFAIPAIPLAYILARKRFPGNSLLRAIIDIPVVIPHSAAGIAVLGFISRDSLMGRMASEVGISFVGQPAGIALAMAFVSIPFLVNSARDGFEAVPERLEKAALNLGASPFRIFFTISLPLAWRSVLSGLVLMFGRGMSEFGAVVIVAYHPMITPVLIYERFGSFGLQYARPVAVIFIVICLIFFAFLRYLSGSSLRQNDQ
jgi:molybdate/tungstate transport system permease protein